MPLPHHPAHPPTSADALRAGETLEQGPENCCTVFQTFHSPAQTPPLPPRGTVKHAPETCCTVFHRFHSPGPRAVAAIFSCLETVGLVRRWFPCAVHAVRYAH